MTVAISETDPSLEYEPLEYDPRYYIQSAKSSISSVGHIIAEAFSNSDEAISRRAKRDGMGDAGTIRVTYDPDSMLMRIADDGAGMNADEMKNRLKKVGASALEGAKRGFFHRGIRDVFIATGVSTVESIGIRDGEFVYSRASFDPRLGMAFAERDTPVTDEIRASLRLERTGTVLAIPMKRLASQKPKLFEFGTLKSQIENCVPVRPVLGDEDREILLEYADSPAKRLHFAYPRGDELVPRTTVTVAGHSGSFWASAADKPIGGGFGNSKLTRRYGVLIRGERAAYEVTTGDKLRTNPVMQRVYGELRLDDIEALQREADQEANDEAQLIYKADRSGLNPDHDLVEAIYAFIDETLTPLVAELEAKAEKKEMTPDMRRQLNKLAQIINKAVESAPFGGLDDPGGKATIETDGPDGPPPPPPPPKEPREVEDMEFAYEKIFVNAGQSRTVKLYFNTDKIPPGTSIELVSEKDEIVREVKLSSEVPTGNEHGVAAVDVTIVAHTAEGRHEVEVRAGGYATSLPVHVRYPRASGFISQIVLDERDWQSGSALYDPATGRVTVFIGRPEFRSAALRAKRDSDKDPMKHPLYRELVVESIREAALRPAAQRKAEVEWDDLPYEERQERDAFLNLVLTEYNALDYQLRGALLDAFLNAGS
jgi:hypothetical protein